MKPYRKSARRELLMWLVFQMSVMDDWGDYERDGFIEYNLDSSEYSEFSHLLANVKNREYFNSVLDSVRDNMDTIDGLIEKASDNWKFERIAKVDLAVIRLACAEMLYADDIPVSVSINEAVDLARKYGGEKSPVFVNGVLGKIAKAI